MMTLEFADPALGNLVDGDGVDEVQFLATLSLDRDQVGALQYRQMLGHGLTGHIESCAQFIEGLPITTVQTVQQGAAAGISQGAEYAVVSHGVLCNQMVACQGKKKGHASGAALGAISRDEKR